MSTPAETASLYAALEQVLGREPAETLMEQLPAGGHVATQKDIRALEVTLRGDLDSRFDRIDARFEKIDARFEKIDDRLYDFHETLRSYARTFLVVQTATVFGVAGIVLGITQLL
ncbi:MAG: hypothetical protein E2O97_03985 [Acidobacteria bacterium]|nr:hypothetical protein [Acidobacteriota bacterium]TDI51918.1 MAG: hypothetical protein E2O97_03985 [Acidobacteriota bacterium]